MNQNQAEVKQEPKIDQEQIAQTNLATTQQSNPEPAPEIKSEENKTNWKHFREQREQERKAAEEANRRALEKAAEAEALKKALEALTSAPQRPQDQYHGYQDNEETEEQRLDRLVEEKIKKREEQILRERQERERREAPQRILEQYPDWNQVVSTENCDYIDYHYPEISTPFKYMPDGYEKWVAMYKAVKKFVPNTQKQKEIAKVEQNLQKPGSISSTGTSQGVGGISAPRLDEARKQANWERMQKALKGLS